jgi:eukaryotic-like serine/threonine-protein kinase
MPDGVNKPAGAASPINRRFGEYALLRRLAVGGQSEVFLALKVGPGDYLRPVVIKALPRSVREQENFLELFFKEAFISSRFAHPNVITVHDARLVEQEYCLIMDFVAGQTVSDIAQRAFKGGKPLTLNQTVQIIADACDGLHYTHHFRDLDDTVYDIVHCDISPQNLMVTYHGVTKVFDFGISQILGYTDSADGDVPVGGKFAYMSPEQCQGKPVDARSDLFSLGIILYELCTGYRLFRRPSQPEVIRAVIEEPIRKPTSLRPDLPLFLERCIMRALARDPNERYQSAAAMRDDLLQFLSMSSRGSERDELGRLVASLFEEERRDIAKVLREGTRQAHVARSMGELSLGELDLPSEPIDEQTLELEAPRASQMLKLQNIEAASAAAAAAPSAEANAHQRAQDQELHRTRERLEAFQQALADSQRRQNILLALVVVLVLVAVGAVLLPRL